MQLINATLKDTLPSTPGMYILSNPNRTLCYVGSTGNLNNRRISHISSIKGKYDCNNPGVQALFDEHGLNLLFNYIKATDREHAYDLEQAYLDEHYGQPYLLNKAKDARMSAKGIPMSEELRQRHSQRMMGNTLGVGKVVSEYQKQRTSEANKGNTYCKGRVVTEEQREATRQRSLGNKYGVGRVWSEESRKKASESAKKKVVTDAARASYRANAIKHHGKSILCKNYANQTLTIYECSPDIERELGILQDHVKRDVNKQSTKLRGGCLFKHVNAEDPNIGIWPEYTQEEGIKSRDEYLAYLKSADFKRNATEVHLLDRTTGLVYTFPTVVACANYLGIHVKTLGYIMGTIGNKKLKIYGQYIAKAAKDNRAWTEAVPYNSTKMVT